MSRGGPGAERKVAVASEADTRVAVGVDTGGTFTDLVAVRLDNPEAPPIVLKVPSTPADPAQAINDALVELERRLGCDFAEISYFAHGTTVGTNAMLEGRLARTGMIVTRGFSDVVDIARQRKPDLYDLSVQKPTPISPRRFRAEIRERMAYDGGVVDHLDIAAVRDAMRRFREDDIEAVAICFLHSFTNNIHETQAKEVAESEFPAAMFCTSHEVLAEHREFERFSTTLVNAALMPIMRNYLQRLHELCQNFRVPTKPSIMQSNGGLGSIEMITQLPITSLYSGPSAGVISAIKVSERAGYDDLITLDVGGTSTDVCLVVGGQPAFLRERKVAGHAVKLDSLGVQSIGAGGGSIVSVDGGGFLQVGPESTGAEPGPACYGRGGSQPTITDAHVVLGRLGDAQALGDGTVRLHKELAISSFEPVSNVLQISVVESAQLALSVMNGNIARAIKLISLDRGYDPRDFALLVYGGAGPMHAADVAELLGMSRLMIPFAPGVLCAAGLLDAPARLDLKQTYIDRATSADPTTLEATYRELERRALALITADLADSKASLRIEWTADMTFLGQEHALTVPVDRGVFDEPAIARLDKRFRQAYEDVHGYSPPDAETRIVSCRVTLTNPTPTEFRAASRASRAAEPIGARQVIFSNRGLDAALLNRDSLPKGALFDGPAIVGESDSTIVIPPGWKGSVDSALNIVLESGA